MAKKSVSQPAFSAEKFQLQFRNLLSDDAERLYQLELGMMQADITAGWRCFYAEEVWLGKELPQPLVNDKGKAVNVENLRRILRDGRDAARCEPDPYDYRNYLDIGWPDIYRETESDSGPRDLVANAVITRLLESEHRNMLYEVERDKILWYAEAAKDANLTPPLVYGDYEPPPPARNETLPLALDTQYWRSIYPSKRPATDTQYHSTQTKPDYIVGLMAQLASDFSHQTSRSTGKSLFFTAPGEREVQWAVLIEKTDGSPTYRYPPRLALIRSGEKKVRPVDVLYEHYGLKKRYHSSVSNPRDIEIQLRFHLPRIRKQIAFLDPFVDAALGAAT